MEEFRDAHHKFCDGDWNFEKPKKAPAPAAATPPPPQPMQVVPRPAGSSSSSSTQTSSGAYVSPWSCADAEMKRQRRVVKYRSYAVEGKLKASVKNSLRWIKNKYCEYVYR
ncbi:hypothetical protein M5689_005411 [Euphorbia peplus]|nr:hypothetical protein M5689_005411 [Euphorbia peplus]